MFTSIKIFFQAAAERSQLITAINVALIVGVILNLINQGDAFIHLNIEHLNLTKFILTFFVPFGVSAYSSAILKLKMEIGKKAKISAKVKCVSCGGNSMEIHEGDLIEECVTCGDKTIYKVTEIIK